MAPQERSGWSLRSCLLDSRRSDARAPRRPTSEDPAIDLNDLVEPVVGALAVALGVAILVLLVLVILLARQIGRLRRRLNALTRGSDGSNLGGVLEAHLGRVDAVGRQLDEVAARSAVIEAAGRHAIQRVGLVRFNPFEDTGGNQSFALALTDASGGGIVVSSLHARTGTRVYAKAVTGGRSDSALSDEEQRALRIALEGSSGASSGSRDRGAESS